MRLAPSSVIALLAICVPGVTQTRALDPLHPAQFQMKGAEPGRFSVSLQTGQYVRVRASCSEYSLGASLARPSAPAPGEILAKTSSLGGTGGAATLAAIADTDGEYLLTLTPSAAPPATGECVIAVDALREATASDRQDAAAYLAFGATNRDYARIADLAGTAGDMDLARLNAIFRGRALIAAGKYQDARQLMTVSVALGPDQPDPRSEAAMRYVAGLSGIYLEDNRAAIEDFERALSLQRAEKQTPESAVTLHNLSVSRWSLGECRDALAEAQEALSMRRRIGDRRGEGYTLLAIAKDHLCLGDSQQALDTYNAVLPLWRSLGNEQQEAAALNDLGVLYVDLGDYPQAGACHKQALEIRRRLKDGPGEAESLNNVGQLKQNVGDFPAALAAYKDALRLQREAHFTRGEAYALQGEADALTSLGNHQEGLPLAQESVRLLHEIGERAGEGYAWQVVARCQLGLHQSALAKEAFEHALALERAVGQQSQESETLASLARIEFADGQLERSRTRIEEALRLIEHGRTDVISPLLRSSFAAKQRTAYEFAAGVLMNLAATKGKTEDFESAAFEVSERTHARGLLDALAENRADIMEGVNPALIARQRALELELNARVDAMARINASEKARSEGAIEQLLRQREQLDAELRKTSPHYADLISPQPPSRKDVQELLPGDSVLLEYLVGADKTWLFLIGRNHFTTFQLPGRQQIDGLVAKLYAAIDARNRRDARESLAARQVRFRRADADTTRLLGQLRSILLPAGALTAGQGSVLIVPDESLQYVPFSALLPEYRIALLPSAGTFKEFSREGNTSRPLSPLLLIGDPVFGPDDERLTARASSGPKLASEPGALTRLRNSRREVENIATLASPAESVMALDFDASPAALKRADLPRFGVIHIASHALLNDSHPDLSGIALSTRDRSGNATGGFVRLHEIYNLHLRAGLVTLSACGTALGRDIKGEGLASLARGFLYAGTTRVLASLWSVDDQTTAEFMSRFYRNIYRRHLAPAAALHAAAAEMRQMPQWKAPYYWAAFTLQGDPD